MSALKNDLITALCFALPLLSACGGNVITEASPDRLGQAGAAAASAGEPGTGGGDHSSRVPGTGSGGLPPDENLPRGMGTVPDLTQCPTEEPALEAACTADGAVCTYGNEVRVDCRHALRCASGKWMKHEGWGDCRSAPKTYCPAAPPSGACTPVTWEGQPIEGRGQAVCDYAGGATCVCSPCLGENCVGFVWDCAMPPAKAACPAIAPNLGGACAVIGVTCNYGFPCQGGASFVCKDSVWYPLPAQCSG